MNIYIILSLLVTQCFASCQYNDCMHYSTCIPTTNPEGYMCQCAEGYNGTYCEIDIHICALRNPCRNEAECRRKGLEYECQCPRGYIGDYCQDITLCDMNPCKNQGVCIEIEGNMERVMCRCHFDFTGHYCQDFNACAGKEKCLNGGNCVAFTGSYMCICSKGYYGNKCQHNRECDVNPCKNGGVCKSFLGRRYRCQCKLGFMGNTCLINRLCVYEPCRNGAKCQQYKNGFRCKCRPGFSGFSCDDNLMCDNNPCFYGGTCKEQPNGFKCICAIGYYGKLCNEIKPSNHTGDIGRANDTQMCDTRRDFYCLHGGKCLVSGIYIRCICKHGFKGDTCRDGGPCASSPCENNGQCKYDDITYDVTCFCQNGYLGLKCESKNYCSENPCKNGGLCHVSTNEYKCLCMNNFKGKNCTENGCSTTYCKNGGTCVEIDSVLKCACMDNFNGDICQNDILLLKSQQLPITSASTNSDEFVYLHTFPQYPTTQPTSNGSQNASVNQTTTDQVPSLKNSEQSSKPPTAPKSSKPSNSSISANSSKSSISPNSTISPKPSTAPKPSTSSNSSNSPTASNTVAANGNYKTETVTFNSKETISNLVSNSFSNDTTSETSSGNDVIATMSGNGTKNRTSTSTSRVMTLEPTVTGILSMAIDQTTKAVDFTKEVTGGGGGALQTSGMPQVLTTVNRVTTEQERVVLTDDDKNTKNNIKSNKNEKNGRKPNSILGKKKAHKNVNKKKYIDKTKIDRIAASRLNKQKSAKEKTKVELKSNMVKDRKRRNRLAKSLCREKPCHNRGKCRVNYEVNKPYVCICKVGYSGRHCSLINTAVIKACKSSPCQNGGTCSATVDFNFYCSCQKGYHGVSCEANNIEPCSSHRCSNRGRCLRDVTNEEVFCDCDLNYYGTFCEKYSDGCSSSPCLNNATCLSLVDGASYCICGRGYSGLSCEEKLDPTAATRGRGGGEKSSESKRDANEWINRHPKYAKDGGGGGSGADGRGSGVGGRGNGEDSVSVGGAAGDARGSTRDYKANNSPSPPKSLDSNYVGSDRHTPMLRASTKDTPTATLTSRVFARSRPMSNVRITTTPTRLSVRANRTNSPSSSTTKTTTIKQTIPSPSSPTTSTPTTTIPSTPITTTSTPTTTDPTTSIPTTSTPITTTTATPTTTTLTRITPTTTTPTTTTPTTTTPTTTTPTTTTPATTTKITPTTKTTSTPILTTTTINKSPDNVLRANTATTLSNSLNFNDPGQSTTTTNNNPTSTNIPEMLSTLGGGDLGSEEDRSRMAPSPTNPSFSSSSTSTLSADSSLSNSVYPLSLSADVSGILPNLGAANQFLDNSNLDVQSTPSADPTSYNMMLGSKSEGDFGNLAASSTVDYGLNVDDGILPTSPSSATITGGKDSNDQQIGFDVVTSMQTEEFSTSVVAEQTAPVITSSESDIQPELPVSRILLIGKRVDALHSDRDSEETIRPEITTSSSGIHNPTTTRKPQEEYPEFSTSSKTSTTAQGDEFAKVDNIDSSIKHEDTAIIYQSIVPTDPGKAVEEAMPKVTLRGIANEASALPIKMLNAPSVDNPDEIQTNANSIPGSEAGFNSNDDNPIPQSGVTNVNITARNDPGMEGMPIGEKLDGVNQNKYDSFNGFGSSKNKLREFIPQTPISRNAETSNVYKGINNDVAPVGISDKDENGYPLNSIFVNTPSNKEGQKLSDNGNTGNIGIGKPNIEGNGEISTSLGGYPTDVNKNEMKRSGDQVETRINELPANQKDANPLQSPQRSKLENSINDYGFSLTETLKDSEVSNDNNYADNIGAKPTSRVNNKPESLHRGDKPKAKEKISNKSESVNNGKPLNRDQINSTSQLGIDAKFTDANATDIEGGHNTTKQELSAKNVLAKLVGAKHQILLAVELTIATICGIVVLCALYMFFTNKVEDKKKYQAYKQVPTEIDNEE